MRTATRSNETPMNSRESRSEAMISRIDECLDEYEQWLSGGRIRLDLRPPAPSPADGVEAQGRAPGRTKASAGKATRTRK